jgi:hypothetical protein
MKGCRLLTVSVLTLVLACGDDSTSTGPKGLAAPVNPASTISDGANGGNPDFFFLPPMVSNPASDPNYEPLRFHDGLAPRLTVEICLLQGSPVNAQGQPVATDCVAGAPVKKFGVGTVRLMGMPDGFYQVSWNTRESNLDVTKYYRIKVLVEGAATPLGFADIDPMDNRSQVKNTRTGELISLIDDSTRPIKFRVEKSALCPGENLCTSTIITNHTPNGEPQIVQVMGSDGSAIAGVLIPDGFLPSTSPQSVVLTIERVNTGVNNLAAGTQSIPCHENLPLQQFDSCFHFSTIPQLPVISEDGHQFLKALTLAVCFVLHDRGDAREPWVQLWSSDEGGADTKALPSASAAQILSGAGGETCGENLVASNVPTNGLTRFASVGWKKLRGGLGQLFGVKTAYAVDVGIGGLSFDLSNIGPALTAEIRRHTDTDLTFGAGATTTATARIVGTRVHNSGPLTTGIGDLPVTFTVAPGHGSLRLIGSEAPGAAQVTSITNTNPINPESPTSGGGFAPVNWTLPNVRGTYTLTATGQATGGPVTFTATVNVDEVWQVIESGGWNATWTRRGSTGVFDGVWVPAGGGQGQNIAVMDYTRNGTQVHFQRTSSSEGALCTYNGTLAADGLSASGTETCPGNPTTYTWTATITAPYPYTPALNLLAGTWLNEDQETGNVTRIDIGIEGSSASVSQFGRCVPTDCPFGTVAGNTSQWTSNQVITAFWDHGFATRTETITYLSSTRLRIVMFTDFTPEDGRTDYTITEFFTKQEPIP